MLPRTWEKPQATFLLGGAAGLEGMALTSWVHLSVQYPVRMKLSSPGGMAITGVYTKPSSMIPAS